MLRGQGHCSTNFVVVSGSPGRPVARVLSCARHGGARPVWHLVGWLRSSASQMQCLRRQTLDDDDLADDNAVAAAAATIMDAAVAAPITAAVAAAPITAAVAATTITVAVAASIQGLAVTRVEAPRATWRHCFAFCYLPLFLWPGSFIRFSRRTKNGVKPSLQQEGHAHGIGWM